ncbi:MAG: 2-dehydropantoate 2-reductase [Betaproteobacteria bacterium]|nr:2-dehydropantoate 2-reductase [Betaproteobacteria bacterium]
MKICIVGAGSIGGYVGVKLAQAGEDVTLIARNANLEAIRSRGMRLTMADGVEHVVRHINASASLAEAGPQDLVILGMKANQLAAVIKDLPHLLHDNTVIVPMQNGIPFWYFQRHGGEFEDRVVHSVDPDGHIMRAIDPSRILGCVVYPACELAAPGWVRHIEGDRFPLGELDGRESERVLAISAMFANAGLKAPVLNNIRSEIWLKLWGNLTFNPISALTHSTLVDICQFPLSRELAASMMREAEAVATRLGISFRVTLEKRIAGAEKVGKHKTSMLQDVESGRDPEIDALVGAVIELGKITAVPTPHIETVYALMKLLSVRINDDKLAVRAQPMVAA